MDGVEEANRVAVESCKRLVILLAQPKGPLRSRDVAGEADTAVARFDKVVTMLSNRQGHARARIGKESSSQINPKAMLDHPSLPCSSSPRTAAPSAKITAKFDHRMFLETPLLDLNASRSNHSNGLVQTASNGGGVTATTTHIHFQKQQKQQVRYQFDQQNERFHVEMPKSSGNEITFSFDKSICTSSAATSSFFSSCSIDRLIGMSGAAASPAVPATKKASARKGEDGNGKCHCPKKRKPREKRVIRVPAISDKVADIPVDNYSWRKYGQKPIKGSPHPRGYYKCSSRKDCMARKHVERCTQDAAMLIVTYENDHNHAQPLDLSALQP